MNIYDTPHSVVKREGKDYSEVPRSLTTGTKTKELLYQGFTTPAAVAS